MPGNNQTAVQLSPNRKPVGPVFKFLKNRDLHFLRRGSLKFGRLKYYQLLEIALERQGIGDLNEGVVRRVHDPMIVRGDFPEDEEKRAIAASMGVQVGGKAIVHMAGNVLSTEVDCFVFCVALGPFEQAKSVLTDPSALGERYGAAVRIDDLRVFTERVLQTGTINGQPLIDVIGEVTFAPVVYEENVANVSRQDPLVPSAFRKLPSFASQREFRIALFPKKPIDADALIVEAPGIEELMTICLQGEPDEDEPVQSCSSEDEMKAELCSRVREISAIYNGRIDPLKFSLDEFLSKLQTTEQDAEAKFWEQKPEIVRLYWDLRCAGLGDQAVDDSLRRLRRGSVRMLIADLERLMTKWGFS